MIESFQYRFSVIRIPFATRYSFNAMLRQVADLRNTKSSPAYWPGQRFDTPKTSSFQPICYKIIITCFFFNILKQMTISKWLSPICHEHTSSAENCFGQPIIHVTCKRHNYKTRLIITIKITVKQKNPNL